MSRMAKTLRRKMILKRRKMHTREREDHEKETGEKDKDKKDNEGRGKRHTRAHAHTLDGGERGIGRDE